MSEQKKPQAASFDDVCAAVAGLEEVLQRYRTDVTFGISADGLGVFSRDSGEWVQSVASADPGIWCDIRTEGDWVLGRTSEYQFQACPLCGRGFGASALLGPFYKGEPACLTCSFEHVPDLVVAAESFSARLYTLTRFQPRSDRSLMMRLGPATFLGPSEGAEARLLERRWRYLAGVVAVFEAVAATSPEGAERLARSEDEETLREVIHLARALREVSTETGEDGRRKEAERVLRRLAKRPGLKEV